MQIGVYSLSGGVAALNHRLLAGFPAGKRMSGALFEEMQGRHPEFPPGQCGFPISAEVDGADETMLAVTF
jgi:hypothetical protein